MTSDLKSVGLLTRRGTDNIIPIVGDDGALAGSTVGKQRETWDGRVDAKALAYEIHPNPQVELVPGRLLKVPGGSSVRIYPDGRKRRLVKRFSGDRGAFSASGIFYLTLRDIFQNDTAVDLLADTIKLALFTNSITTPNYATNTAYGAAPFNANEVSGTGYTAGGAALANDTITESSGDLVYDADDTSWTSSTFSSVRGGLLYDDTITTPTADPGVAGITFGADYSVTSGTFTVQYAATGIVRYDLP